MKLRSFSHLPAAVLTLSPALVSHAETYENRAAACFTPAEISAGLASPGGDHDGDHCPNLFEYFGDTLPKDDSSHLLLNFGFDVFLNEVTVSFPTGPDRSDIDHVVMLSDDLLTWSEDTVLK